MIHTSVIYHTKITESLISEFDNPTDGRRISTQSRAKGRILTFHHEEKMGPPGL